ncbi:SMI1/KNR4 family protein SUKH-1 [Saccharothrix carnea]|uniref:SMI1/KNR4 family protein SUKH-1 n=1 Tax=Saccharothrix carnea TaxID=1280637 RepID=A0A2P8IBL9_SACCR|nr:SMI1/KNR4 family protein [Saccharothrix carnea]PSL55850.1 SMI1/KNR4 family protein SUKH-1 [Saccharothrix carnea]
MTVGYRRQEPSPPPGRIAELERRIGRPLPAAYRDYLAGTDGGRLEDNHEAVQTIFGIGEVPDWANLWRKLDVYRGRVPEWLLPVANDEYGNLFCVSLRDSDMGAVWFWDHEEEADEGEPPAEDNLTFKAETWPGFLASLRAVR